MKFQLVSPRTSYLDPPGASDWRRSELLISFFFSPLLSSCFQWRLKLFFKTQSKSSSHPGVRYLLMTSSFSTKMKKGHECKFAKTTEFLFINRFSLFFAESWFSVPRTAGKWWSSWMSHIPYISVHYSCWFAFEICSLFSNECMLTMVSSFRNFYIPSLPTKILCFELF